MSGSVGVVVPAYRADVDRLREYLRSIEGRIDPAVIRIEWDAPRPGEADRLTDVAAAINTVSRRRGKGAAITAGFEALDTDVLAFADADGATPAAELATVIDTVRPGAAATPQRGPHVPNAPCR